MVKIQIGLLGLARDLQLDLEKIADKADTSSPEGLHYVLEETVLALLRNPEYCVYGYATSNSARGPEEAEDLFNEMSMVGLRDCCDKLNAADPRGHGLKRASACFI